MGALVGSGSGCLSPTLPLPPPEPPDAVSESATGEGTWDVRGVCTPGARVLVKNLDNKVIAGRDDDDYDGHYLIPIQADLCDDAMVFELVDDNLSEGTFFIIQPTVNGLSDDSCD
ncbi:MAG: hypothetical protein JRI68_01530 [Deltaproteobacteria bacterium]|nr:hypothetical protein [Deltaproteobacteria bacterium]